MAVHFSSQFPQPAEAPETNRRRQQLNVGTTASHDGKSITITAKGGGDPQTVVLTTTMQTVSFTGSGIKKITIEDADPMTPACLVVIDDIQLTPE